MSAGTLCVLPPGVYLAAYEYESSLGMISTIGSACSSKIAAVNSRPTIYCSTNIRPPKRAAPAIASAQSARSLTIPTPTDDPCDAGLTTHGQPISGGGSAGSAELASNATAAGVGTAFARMSAFVISL